MSQTPELESGENVKADLIISLASVRNLTKDALHTMHFVARLSNQTKVEENDVDNCKHKSFVKHVQTLQKNLEHTTGRLTKLYRDFQTEKPSELKENYDTEDSPPLEQMRNQLIQINFEQQSYNDIMKLGCLEDRNFLTFISQNVVPKLTDPNLPMKDGHIYAYYLLLNSELPEYGNPSAYVEEEFKTIGVHVGNVPNRLYNYYALLNRISHRIDEITFLKSSDVENPKATFWQGNSVHISVIDTKLIQFLLKRIRFV